MAWRLLMRGSPSRSMTVVGDVAQTGDLAGAGALGGDLRALCGRPLAADAELTVNYRTPAEIMEVAAAVLATHRPRPQAAAVGAGDRRQAVDPKRSSSRAGGRPAQRSSGRRRRNLDGGRLGVIVPETGRTAKPTWRGEVAVLTVRQAKGLEFDSVIVVDPARHREQLAARPQRPVCGPDPGHAASRSRHLQRQLEKISFNRYIDVASFHRRGWWASHDPERRCPHDNRWGNVVVLLRYGLGAVRQHRTRRLWHLQFRLAPARLA